LFQDKILGKKLCWFRPTFGQQFRLLIKMARKILFAIVSNQLQKKKQAPFQDLVNRARPTFIII